MAIALIASASVNGGYATSAIDTSGADGIVLIQSTYGSLAGASPTDNKSNSWTALTGYGASSSKIRLFYCLAPTVGTGHTFTPSSDASYPGFAVLAFSGVKQTAAFDVESGASADSGTSIQPGSVTPSENGEVLVAGLGGYYAFGTTSINSSFITTSSVDYIAAGLAAFGAYLVQGSAGATNPTWSWANSTVHVTAIATFKAASVATANPKSPLGGIMLQGPFRRVVA